MEVKVWDSDWTNDHETLFQNTPFFTHELKIIGTVSEWDGELQIEPSTIQIINDNFDFQSNNVSISSIFKGDHDGTVITCKGLLVDYFESKFDPGSSSAAAIPASILSCNAISSAIVIPG